MSIYCDGNIQYVDILYGIPQIIIDKNDLLTLHKTDGLLLKYYTNINRSTNIPEDEQYLKLNIKKNKTFLLLFVK